MVNLATFPHRHLSAGSDPVPSAWPVGNWSGMVVTLTLSCALSWAMIVR